MTTIEAQTLADLLARVETLAESYVDMAVESRRAADDRTREASDRAADIAAASVYDAAAKELRGLLK